MAYLFGKHIAGGGGGIPDPLTVSNLFVTNISNLSTINGAAYVPGGGGPGNISQWSTCNAVSTINAGGNDISNVNDLYVTADTVTGYLSVLRNATITSNLTVSGLTTILDLSYAGFTDLSTYTRTNITSICGAISSLSGTVNNLSGYTYSNVTSICGAISSLSSTVNNLSGYTYNNVTSICGALLGYSTSFTTITLNVCSLATLSGLTVNNNVTVSNLLTTSGLTVNNNVNVSGLTTLSGLTVNNNAQIISNLSVGTINGYAYPNVLFEGFGTNIIRVDVCGNDTIASANKYIYPFQTISAALLNAVSGNEVFVSPGTYNQSSKLVIPAGVSLRGANTNGVFIQNVGATTSFTLLEMLSNTRIEDVTLTLTSPTQTLCGADYVVVAMSGTNIPSIKLRTMVINANNSNIGGNVYGIYASGDANTNTAIPVSGTTVRGTTINVNTSGQTGGATAKGSNARCIYSTGSNRVSIRDTNCFLTGTNCSGATLYGCETTVSGSWMDLQSSAIAAATAGTSNNCSVAEISQTNSNSVITLGATHLLYHSANGKGFSSIQLVTNFIYGVYQTTNWDGNFNMNGYLFPGTTLLSAVAATSTTDAFPYTVPEDCILTRVLLRVNPSAILGTNGAPIMHVKIFTNEDFATPIITLSLTGTTRVAKSNNFSKRLLANDRIYVNMSNVGQGSGGGGVSNVTNLFSAVVDFELY